MAKRPPWFNEDLVLGWRLTKTVEPQHWSIGGRAGEHARTDLVSTTPKGMAHHTIIVAQSGSGKSYFLGRIIEEILLKTRARVLILDFNSDFRKLALSQPDSSWSQRRFSRTSKKWFLAEEPTSKDFTDQWHRV